MPAEATKEGIFAVQQMDTERKMVAKTVLMILSAGIAFSLGIAHLAFTFFGPKLLPRDSSLIDSMKAVPLVITTETTVWKAWIGFNASHSMALILFALVYGYLAIAHPDLLYSSPFLLLLGFLVLAGFLVLSWLYWFSGPLAGISVALICYAASIFLARA